MSATSAWRQVGLAVAVAVAIAAQLQVHAEPHRGAAWAVLATAALLAALLAVRPAVPRAPDRGHGAANAWRCAGLAAAAVAVAATTLLASYGRWPVLGLLLWLAAVPLAALALRGWQVTPAARPAAAWTRRERLALAAVLLLAALARVLWLDTLPRAIFGDEPRVAMHLRHAFGPAVPLPGSYFVMGWNTWPALGLALEGLFVPLLGLNVTALRASSALMGTLGVAATYLLARALSGPRLALCAALLLAVCRTSIDFSRLGIAHAQILLLEPLALYFLWRAWNGGRAASWLLAGAASGWCLYSYNAGQLVPPLVIGWLALGALAAPARLRTHWRGAALLGAGFVLVVFPYVFYFTDGFGFGPQWDQWTVMARNRQTLGRVSDAWQSAGLAPAWEILRRQIWITWLGFGVLPGGGYGLGYRHGGMLDDVSAALFVLGLAMALRRLRHGPHAFLLYWWLATVLVGGIATVDPPSFVRMIGLVPAVAILAALPLDALIAAAGAAAVRRRLALAAAAALIAAAAWINWRTYFVELAAQPADSVSELARYLEARPADERAALLGAEHHLGLQREAFEIQFTGRGRDMAEPAHFLPLHEPIDTPLALILGPSQSTLAPYIQALYPGTAVTDVSAQNGALLYFRALHLTPASAARRTGLALHAERGADAPRQVTRADPFGALPAAVAGADRLLWTGSIYWPSTAPLDVQLRSTRPATLTIATAPPLHGAGGGTTTAARLTLPRGWLPITIEERGGGARGLDLTLHGDGPARALTRWQLRPERGEGLRATYRRPDGMVAETVDPTIDSHAVEVLFRAGDAPIMRMPFTAVWRGALRIDTPGEYVFDAIGSGPFAVSLDGTPLLAAAPRRPEDPVEARQTRLLDAGLHPIEAHFDSTQAAHTSRRLFQLFWTPPGGERALIPPPQFVVGFD